jgi:hypothetical protein
MLFRGSSILMLRGRPQHASLRRSLARTFLVAALTASATACASKSALQPGAEPAVDKKTSIVGRVTKTTGKDTVGVAGAIVNIRDLRLTTQTDSAGFYEFRVGLIPGRFKVSADLDGLRGSTADPVPVTVGETTRVAIHLGGTTSWPPPIELDTSIAARVKAPGRIRP